jgi:hypothetical protein
VVICCTLLEGSEFDPWQDLHADFSAHVLNFHVQQRKSFGNVKNISPLPMAHSCPPSEMDSTPLPRWVRTSKVHTDTRDLKSFLDVYIQVIRHVTICII